MCECGKGAGWAYCGRYCRSAGLVISDDGGPRTHLANDAHWPSGRWGPVFALTTLTSMSDVQRVDNDRLGAFDLVGWCIVAFSEYRQGDWHGHPSAEKSLLRA